MLVAGSDSQSRYHSFTWEFWESGDCVYWEVRRVLAVASDRRAGPLLVHETVKKEKDSCVDLGEWWGLATTRFCTERCTRISGVATLTFNDVLGRADREAHRVVPGA